MASLLQVGAPTARLSSLCFMPRCPKEHVVYYSMVSYSGVYFGVVYIIVWSLTVWYILV